MSSSLPEDGRYVLETGRADRSVWLMKCPPVVSRAWHSAATEASSASAAGGGGGTTTTTNGNNPVVAKVVLSLDPLRPEDPTSLQFKMEMVQNDSGNATKCYSLNMFKDFVPLCTFSESNQGKFSLEGKVEHKFDMEPHSDHLKEYSKICRERTKKADLKTRQVQIIDNDHGGLMRPMPGMVGLIPKEKRKPTPTKGPDAKRTRRDRSELENIIFKLFERQPNWALKQLVQETDQPEQFLKEILNDLCVYNKRGPNQGTHELKPEYKKSAEDRDPAAS